MLPGSDGGSAASPADVSRRSRRGRLVVVSNRVSDPSAGAQSGGLAVALGEALLAAGGIWFGWDGDIADDGDHTPVRKTTGGVDLITVPLTSAEHKGYYLGFANRCLWPLLHYRLDLADLSTVSETSYYEVNRRFARELSPFLRADDTIWVHDYHLMPLGSYLRQEGVTNSIGFFLHIPFPSPEIFSALPNHQQLARSLFAYELVGFQTIRDRENFARYTVEHLGCRRLNDGRISGFGRKLAVDAFPIGIDARSFAAQAEKNVRAPRLRALARSADNLSFIVGVDRLDYTKGLPERIHGIEKLLKSHSVYRGRIQFLQIAPPTREGLAAYDAIRAEFERMTGHANGRFGDFSWSPINYVHRAVARPILAGLFRRCRVGLVTPLRDGMNLVAKEYVAAQDPEDPGVLVLSEFAGAAEQLEEALIVNPHDPSSMAGAIRQALEMPLGERRARHRALWDRILDQDVAWWRERFLTALARAGRPSSQPARRPASASSTADYAKRPDSPAG